MMLVVDIVLLLGICVGHGAILLCFINYWYGQHLPRALLNVVLKLGILSYPVALLVFWLVFGFDVRGATAFDNELSWRTVSAGYFVLCCVVAFGVLPLLTLRRLLHRPAALVSNHTRSVDVAQRLGHRPLGRGKHRFMASLPGNEVFRVDFAERTLHLPRLPAAWDGLSILHLTDLHFFGSPDREFFQYVMEACRDWEPDLVALTGDYIDSDYYLRWVVPILGRLRWRVAAFAILGNHDSWLDHALIRRRLRRLGMHVVGNTWKQFEVRGEPLVVVGHEGPWFQPAPDLTTCPPGVYRLCLSHTPDNIYWARRQGIDLMLSGHVHGGQIRLPLFGSVLVPSRYGRRFDCGVFEMPPTVLHVSRGLGGEHPVRYGCPPEVTRLVLRPQTASS
jgi:predicted MPP superfamily phosphohydrolase